MANRNEIKVLKELESDGWKVLNRGAPDFLCIKVSNGNIEDSKFVEVKAGSDKLTYEQAIYRKVLKQLGAQYEIRYV